MDNIKKEIMPYSLYEIDTFTVKCDIDEVKQHVQDEDWKEFLELAKPYIDENNKFDKVGYAEFYCNRDVELLYEGYSIFRKNVVKEFGLDPLCYLTLSSVANDYLMKTGCFEGVYKLGGMTRIYPSISKRW